MIGRWIGNAKEFVRNTLFCCALTTFLVLAFKGSWLAVILGLISIGVGLVVFVSKVKVTAESTLVAKILSDLRALWDAVWHGDFFEVERWRRVLDYERGQLYDQEGIGLELKLDFPVIPVVVGMIFGVVLWFLL